MEIQPTLMMGEYITSSRRCSSSSALTFEVPVIIVFLSLANIVSTQQLLRFGRWWVVVASLLAAALTPTQDALSMLLLMGPLIGLYYLAVGVTYLIDLRRSKSAEVEANA